MSGWTFSLSEPAVSVLVKDLPPWHCCGRLSNPELPLPVTAGVWYLVGESRCFRRCLGQGVIVFEELFCIHIPWTIRFRLSFLLSRVFGVRFFAEAPLCLTVTPGGSELDKNTLGSPET